MEQQQQEHEADRCPVCATTMVPVVYGYPTGETFEAADRGAVVLGGCVVWDGRPELQCPRCRHAADRRTDEPPF